MHENGFWELLKLIIQNIYYYSFIRKWVRKFVAVPVVPLYLRFYHNFQTKLVADLLLYCKNMYVFNLSVCIYVMSKKEDLWKLRSNNG